jgi:hypothetical protein
VKFATPIQIGPGAHPAINGYWVVNRGKAAGGMALNTHPYLALRLKKEESYISSPSLGLHGLF